MWLSRSLRSEKQTRIICRLEAGGREAKGFCSACCLPAILIHANLTVCLSHSQFLEEKLFSNWLIRFAPFLKDPNAKPAAKCEVAQLQLPISLFGVRPFARRPMIAFLALMCN